MTMGEKILNMRKARGWNQEELAERIGVTRQAVSRWESDSAKPDADKIIAICDLFGVSADYLLRGISPGREDDRAAVSMEGTVKRGLQWEKIFGITQIIWSLTTLFMLALASGAYPHTVEYCAADGSSYTYNGLRGFLMGNNLEWLVYVIAAVFVLGVICLFIRNLVQWITGKYKNQNQKE